MREKQPSSKPLAPQLAELDKQGNRYMESHILFELKTGGVAGRAEARHRTEILLWAKRLPNMSASVSRTLRNFERNAK